MIEDDDLAARLAAVERERDAAELMVRRLADQAVSDEARIAAVEAQAAEVHGHGADDERAEVERLRGIISRIAVLAASPTPSRNDPHAWDGNETCRCGRGRYSALHEMFDLAASATPTGPERCPECNHEPGCLCAETPTPHGCRTCLATPTEPTEETL